MEPKMSEERTRDSLADMLPSWLRFRETLALLSLRGAADEKGATAIEYALMASGIAAAIAATVFSFGSNLKTLFYDKLAGLL